MAAHPVSSARVPVEERLFSLVLALLATASGLTKAEILSTVQGYRQRYRPGGDNASLERQFERDKDDIRELGVPLETVPDPTAPGDNQRLRYRIPQREYDLPADITFTSAEMTLLSLAARVWREGSLSAESRRALLKLRSLGIDADEPLLGFAPSIKVRDAAFEPLRAATADTAVVRFRYAKPGESDARVRTVTPWALIQHVGRWHVYGYDHDADAPRTFLLARILGPVRRDPARHAHAAPAAPADRALTALELRWQENTALIEVETGTEAAIRLGNRPGTTAPAPGRLRVHYTDHHILADELTGYGPEVRVLEPDAVRDAVLVRLQHLVAAYGKDGVHG